MDANKLRKERIQLFKDAITGNNPMRPPHFGNIWSWKIYDSGHKMSEALHSYEITEKVLRHTSETYPIDSIYEYGWRNPVQATDVLGNNEYIIDDEANSISIMDQCFMEEEDYDALIANPKKFLWEVYLPRKYKTLRDKDNSDLFRQFLGEYGKLGASVGRFGQMLQEEYGLAELANNVAVFDHWGNGFELLFNSMRGIKGLSYDIRRCPEKVEAAIEALDETFLKPRRERAMAQLTKGTSPEFAVDLNPVMLAHTILSPKQFERFYWPHIKCIADYALQEDKLVYLFVEGDSTRFYEFFQELPENRFAVHVEQNDIFDMKKKLPNVTVAGGMPCTLLGGGSPEQCVDYAKKLIDELGYDRKFILSEDKMMSYPADCKRENLKAVSDYIFAFRY